MGRSSRVQRCCLHLSRLLTDYDTALLIATKSRKASQHTAEHCGSIGPVRTHGSDAEVSSVTTALRRSERQRVPPTCVCPLLRGHLRGLGEYATSRCGATSSRCRRRRPAASPIRTPDCCRSIRVARQPTSGKTRNRPSAVSRRGRLYGDPLAPRLLIRRALLGDCAFLPVSPWRRVGKQRLNSLSSTSG